jgi:PAS domain S-box-containing protein
VIVDTAAFAECIVDTVREPLLVLDADLRVQTVNRSFCETFHVSPDASLGDLLYDLGNGQWNIPALRTLLEDVLPQNSQFNDYEVEHDFPDIGHRVMLLNGRRLYREGSDTELILLAIEDITERKYAGNVERRLASVVASSHDAIISKSLDGTIQSWNAAAERLFGYTPEQAVGRHISFLFPADRLVEEDHIIAKLRAGERVEHFETVRVRSDGTPVDVSLTVSPIKDETGRVIGASKIARDITKQRHFQEALQRNEVRQRGQKQAFAATIDGASLEQSLGFLIRSAVDELTDARAAFFLVDADGTQLHPVAATGGMSPSYTSHVDGFEVGPNSFACGLAASLDCPIITPDVNEEPLWKSWLHLAREFDFRGCWSFPINTNAGMPVGTFALYFHQPRSATPQDLELIAGITQAAAIIISQFTGTAERQRAENILAAEKTVLEQIATGAPLHEVLTTLTRGTEALSTDEMLCSVLLVDKAGQRLTHGAGPSLPVEYNQAIDGIPIGPNIGSCGTAAFEGQPVFVTDVATDARWAAFKDLAAQHGLGACCSQPIFNSRRELLGTVAMYYRQAHNPSVRDREVFERAARLAGIVIERARAEEKLRDYAAELSEADRRKNEFLAMLAHELRNPLAPIRNAVQVMRLSGGTDDNVTSATEMMERQVGQMVRLVDDLLDVNRVSRGKIQLKWERLELASVVYHAIEAARPHCERMSQELTVVLPQQPIYLNADLTRLAQVIGNLLNNACKFTDKGGRITLIVEREHEEAVIRVGDSGIGIAPEQLPRIFDMFMQVDTSLERSTSGLGIGLTLVKNLTEMHGGTVEVHSDGIGQGSEFIVRLPIALTTRTPTPCVTASELISTKSRRILIVDDNRDSAMSLAMLLKITGNETHTAHDGLEALEAAERLKPEAMLLDIGLPKLNGFEVCRRIREQPGGDSIVMIALTGWGQDEDRQKSKDAGFDGHLVKPVDLADVNKLLVKRSSSSN